MLERNANEIDAEKVQPPAISSVAALKNKILASTAADANTQKATTQSELAKLRASAGQRPLPEFHPPSMNNNNASTQTTAPPKLSNVAALSAQLFPQW